MKLYTYLPKQNTASIQGILSTQRAPHGWQKYKARSGQQTRQGVIKYLASLSPDRPKAVSVFRTPIPEDIKQQALRQFIADKQLYSIDYNKLKALQLITSITTSAGKQPHQVKEPMKRAYDWNKFQRGKFLFSKVPHYLIATKEGVIPPSVINKEAALTTKQLRQLVDPYYTPQRKVHIREVLNFARQLKQKRLNSTQLAAIYLHDAAKKEQSKGHQARGAQLSRQLLTGKYTPEQVQQIANAIKQHSADLRLTTKDFKHSSPTAELLALADDANITTRDPMWMAMMTARFAHRNPDIYSNDKEKAFKRHISFWSPTESHKNLQWYGKPWSQMTKDVSDKIYNFPQQTWNKLWNTVTADTEIPDAKTWNKIHNYKGV